MPGSPSLIAPKSTTELKNGTNEHVFIEADTTEAITTPNTVQLENDVEKEEQQDVVKEDEEKRPASPSIINRVDQEATFVVDSDEIITATQSEQPEATTTSAVSTSNMDETRIDETAQEEQQEQEVIETTQVETESTTAALISSEVDEPSVSVVPDTQLESDDAEAVTSTVIITEPVDSAIVIEETENTVNAGVPGEVGLFFFPKTVLDKSSWLFNIQFTLKHTK